MAIEVVTVVVSDQQVIPQPIDDVTVQVYDATGVVLQTSGVTGAGGTPGEVEFLLDGVVVGTTYKLRFYKTGVSFTNPCSILVTSPANPSNTFDMSGETHTLPVATDVNMCRCSGYFVDVAGQPLEGLHIIFISRMDPPTPQIVGSGNAAMAVLYKRDVQTDSDGYAVVDLYRNAEYDVIISTQEDYVGLCVIPDASSANLVHVLYPVVANVVYSPVSPLATTVGSIETISLTITFSSGVTHYTGEAPLTISSSDSAIATGTVSGTDDTDATLTVMAVGTGSCTLTPVRSFGSDEQEVVYQPSLSSLPALVVNVT